MGVSNKITRLKKTGEYKKLKEKYSIRQVEVCNDIPDCDFTGVVSEFKPPYKRFDFTYDQENGTDDEQNPVEEIKRKIDDINIYIELYLDDDEIKLYVEDNILKAKAKRINYEEI